MFGLLDSVPWKSLAIHAGVSTVPSAARVVVTNGFFPVLGRRVRAVFGVGVPKLKVRNRNHHQLSIGTTCKHNTYVLQQGSCMRLDMSVESSFQVCRYVELFHLWLCFLEAARLASFDGRETPKKEQPPLKALLWVCKDDDIVTEAAIRLSEKDPASLALKSFEGVPFYQARERAVEERALTRKERHRKKKKKKRMERERKRKRENGDQSETEEGLDGVFSSMEGLVTIDSV